MTKIGFIGAGNMAEAIIRGIITAGQFNPSDIIISDVRENRRIELAERYGIAAVEANTDVAAVADIVVLSVKPQMMADVLAELKGKTENVAVVVSIAAGVTVSTISDALGDLPVVRIMPNTPALVSEGMCGIYSPKASAKIMSVLAEIFSAVGEVIIVESEDLIDAVTAVSGSGPAYFFLLMEEMIKTAKTLGLSDSEATKLVIQTAKGAAILAEIAQSKGETAEELRTKVTSPGGTTEAAINTFKDGNISGLVVKALNAAYNRSKELSK